MTAQDLLAAVQAAVPSIRGLTMRDVANVNTWTFFGAHVTPADAAKAVLVIQATLNPVAPSAPSWPAPNPLGDRVTALEQRLTGV